MTVVAFSSLVRTAPTRPIGYLSGTAKISGAPDVPVKRLVQLFTSSNAHGTAFPTAVAVDWQWSAADGSWRFDGLDPAQKYNVIAYDHSGQYDPVVKLNLVPSVEE